MTYTVTYRYCEGERFPGDLGDISTRRVEAATAEEAVAGWASHTNSRLAQSGLTLYRADANVWRTCEAVDSGYHRNGGGEYTVLRVEIS